MIQNKTCDNYAMLGRCSAGFAYAHFQNHVIGADPVVLTAAGHGGKDLSFAATWEFIEENHLAGRFGVVPEDSRELDAHISTCKSPQCVEAMERVRAASRIMSRNTALDGFLIASQFNPKNGSQPLVLDRARGFGGAIDVLAPVFKGYTDGRSDFVWPGEGRVRLEGHAQVLLGPKIVSIRGYRTEDGHVNILYERVRKVRCNDRDIWRNQNLYHVELSHANEKTGFKDSGLITLELLESLSGVEEIAGKILAATTALKRCGQKSS